MTVHADRSPNGERVVRLHDRNGAPTRIEESDPVAQSLKYVHDASTVDPASRANPAPEQDCSNCALIQGDEGADWRPCQIFPGKLVANKGWCSVWAPKA